MSSVRFVRLVDAALKPVLTDNDRIVASARVVSGPPPAPIALAVFFVNAAAWPGAGMVANRLTPGSLAPPIWLLVALGLAPVLVLALIVACVQRARFLAISSQQLIYARLTAFRRPIRVVSVPLSEARVDGCRRGPRTTTIILTLAGKRLRLHGFAKRQDDLDEVLYLASAAGVPVVAAARRGRRGRRSLQPPFDYGASLTGLPQWSRWPAD